MTADGKIFDPETVTDKQLVQYEQAIDRGLTEADAMRLTEHEYNGFQANAIIAAALNPAVGENVLDALATPKYTAAQMTAIAKIAIRGGDFARFLDPQMDARRILYLSFLLCIWVIKIVDSDLDVVAVCFPSERSKGFRDLHKRLHLTREDALRFPHIEHLDAIGVQELHELVQVRSLLHEFVCRLFQRLGVDDLDCHVIGMDK